MTNTDNNNHDGRKNNQKFGSFGNESDERTRRRDLKLEKSHMDIASAFCDFKSPDALKNIDDKQIWDSAFKHRSQFSPGQVMESYNMFKFNTPSCEKFDAKSPYFKFPFGGMMGSGMVPTPGKHPSNTHDYSYMHANFKAGTPINLNNGSAVRQIDSVSSTTPVTFNFTNEDVKKFNSQDEKIGQGANIKTHGKAPRVSINTTQVTLEQSPAQQKEEIKSQAGSKNKRSKKGSKSKRKNLSSREDVMNKNIFRAIKRQLKEMCADYVKTEAYKSMDHDGANPTDLLTQSNCFSRHLLRTTDYDRGKCPIRDEDFSLY